MLIIGGNISGLWGPKQQPQKWYWCFNFHDPWWVNNKNWPQNNNTDIIPNTYLTQIIHSQLEHLIWIIPLLNIHKRKWDKLRLCCSEIHATINFYLLVKSNKKIAARLTFNQQKMWIISQKWSLPGGILVWFYTCLLYDCEGVLSVQRYG